MHDNDALPPTAPSKSQRKREAHALQALGEQLVGLKPAQLEKLSLPAELYEAVVLAQTLHQRGARKRQLQYIGKLMRRIDAQAVEQAVSGLTATSVAVKRRERYIEQLCDAVLAGEQQALEAFFAEYTNADRQHVRQLIRKALREQEQSKHLKYRRLLFRYLREVMQADAL